ncbi:MAG: ABC transporter substrate-binding protein [Geodermatophilaceae bacterium]
MNALTSGGEKCSDWASCLTIVQAGGDVDYDGQSGPLAFTDAGEPAAASFGVLTFGADNKIDNDLTEFVLAGDEANASTAAAAAAPDPTGAPTGGALTVGTLLPQTGSLAFLGPPEEAGVRVAIAEINAGGGALGQPVALVEGDSGDTSTDTANTTTDRLLQAGANAIIGAASSGVSQTVIDKITGAGVVMFSPANTSDIFTDYDDSGLYFRTAPPDVLQARALADILLADGNTSVRHARAERPVRHRPGREHHREPHRRRHRRGFAPDHDLRPERDVVPDRGRRHGRLQPGRDHRDRLRRVVDRHHRDERTGRRTCGSVASPTQ